LEGTGFKFLLKSIMSNLYQQNLFRYLCHVY